MGTSCAKGFWIGKVCYLLVDKRGDCFRRLRKSVFLSIGVSMCVDNTSLEKGLPSNIHR